MTSLRFFSAVLASSAVLSLAPLASAVMAQPTDPQSGSCVTNADCGKGYECTVVGASSCAPAPACAPGEACPTIEPCTTTEIHECTPAHCEADADCADGMLCHAWASPSETPGCACAPNTACDCAAADPIITAVKLCTPPYLLPCQVDSDCGAGFSCQEQQSCACAGSGSAPAGSSSSGAAPIPPDGAAGAPAADVAPPTCTCEPSGQLECVLKPVACHLDLDCPAGWQCAFSNDVATSPACPPGATCAGEKAAPAEPTSGTCQPPYYGAVSGGDLQTPREAQNGGTPPTGAGPGTTGGTPVSQPNEGTSDGAHESSACQVGHTPASRSTFALLAVLGALVGLTRRRRAQA